MERSADDPSILPLDGSRQHTFLSAEIDCPAGRTDSAPSGATGELLRYFTPDALPDLLHRARSKAPSQTSSRTFGRLDSLAFARAASRRGATGDVDRVQAARLCEAAAASPREFTADDLQGLAGGITGRSTLIRQEIVFSGGRTAGRADHVYAPHGALPELMQSLVTGLAQRFEEVNPAHRAAVIGFFCIHAHPFRDGNGRWSRLVTAGSARDSEGLMPSMVSAAFQATCNRELSKHVWAATRVRGLRGYLELASRFDQRVHAECDGSGVHNVIGDINREIGRVSSSRTGAVAAIKALWSNASLEGEDLRLKLGVSSRSAAGLVQRLCDAHANFVSGQSGQLSVAGILNEVDSSITAAARHLSTELLA